MSNRRNRSSSRREGTRKRRRELLKRLEQRRMLLETLEHRQLLAVGPQLIGIQPNTGELLEDGQVLNVAPTSLTFRFDETEPPLDPETIPDYHIQTEPVCDPRPCDLKTRPISRQPATPPDA